MSQELTQPEDSDVVEIVEAAASAARPHADQTGAGAGAGGAPDTDTRADTGDGAAPAVVAQREGADTRAPPVSARQQEGAGVTGARPAWSVTRRDGDILNCSQPWLVHQLNCVSSGARGLAAVLFDRYPSTNAYARRSGPSTPATIDVAAVRADLRVVGLYSQYYPGTTSSSREVLDDADTRLLWFRESLHAFASHHLREPAARDPTARCSVAVPFLIGCGLAGGDWPSYEETLKVWARRWSVDLVLYRLETGAEAAGRGRGRGRGGGGAGAGAGAGGGQRGAFRMGGGGAEGGRGGAGGQKRTLDTFFRGT